MFYTVYGALTTGLFLVLFPLAFVYMAITRRFKNHFQERLGFLPATTVKSLSGSPRIWIHGASLGEIRVAAAIIKSLREKLPGCAIIVSTVTEHGRDLALDLFQKEIPVVYAPLDIPGCAIKALSFVRPDVMVFLETELWPAWIFTAHRLGIKLALLNGRISPRSLKGYLKFRPFFRSVLRKFDAFGMISETDAHRIRAMGATPGKIRVNGNAKYDNTVILPDQSVETKMRRILNLAPSDRIIVAGSTRGGEEEMLLDAYEKIRSTYPDTLLLLAPRHIKRAGDIRTLIRRRGHDVQLKTEIDHGASRTAKILIIDTFGELFNTYSVATVVFCGASLIPLGGQNPLEPAAWGKPILYGPHMEDFLDAKEMLESARGSIRVADPRELTKTLLHLLENPEEARLLGRHAREVASQTRSAARKHAEIIRILSTRKTF